MSYNAAGLTFTAKALEQVFRCFSLRYVVVERRTRLPMLDFPSLSHPAGETQSWHSEPV